MKRIPKVFLVANTSWYLHNYRLSLIRELQQRHVDVAVVAPLDEWSAVFRDIGVRFIDLFVDRRSVNPFTDLRLLSRLYKLYRTERPDVVFHNTIKPVIYGSIAAKYAGVQDVLNMIPGLGYVYSGNDIRRRALRRITTLLYKYALRHSRKVLFQNPDDKKYFEDSSLVDKGNTLVTYGSGVDLDHFYYVEPVPRRDECCFLLFGRLLWDKGVGEFVKAAKSVRQEHPKTRFQLLGKIDTSSPTHINKKVIDDWHSSGHVEYLGEVSDVREAIGKADVVVLPSYYREGVPKALLEALSMGKPIITTDMPGCRETVVHALSGILIPPRDTLQLIHAMCTMIADPEMRIRMGKEGRTMAVKRFDVNRVNKEMLRAMNIAV